jgi:hypothetical protein
MWTRWSKLCTLLSLVVLASSGCHCSSMKGSAAEVPSVHNDASPDFPSQDLADTVPDLPCDLGTDVREVGVDLQSDLGTDLPDLGSDSPPDVPVALPLDLGADLPDLGTDVRSDTAAWACTSGEPYALVLSGNGEGGLYRFYPDTLSLARIGTLACGSTTSELNSFTVLPVGPAYVSNTLGELCVVDLTTFVASPTSFDAKVVSNRPYGMAVLPDNAPAVATLFIAVRSTGQADTLSRVDLSTFGLTTVGPIQLHQDGGTQPCAGIELTTTSKGGLYGFGVDTDPPLLLAIDPKTGNTVKMAEVPVANPGGFALVEWQGTIYVFFAESGARGSTVFTFRDGDAQVTRIGDIDTAVIGAGVALCH